MQLIQAHNDVSEYQQEVALEGVKYLLTWRWNDRCQRWFVRVQSAAGTTLAAYRKVVADRPLHQREHGVFPGDLWVLDMTGAGTDPGLRDLGERHAVVYVPSA